MPIKLNLLAETQAAEQLRRKDPVKRAIWIGVLVVAGMLVWAGLLYSEGFIAKSNQRQLERAWKDNEKRFLELSEARKQVQELNQKVLALDRFNTNRFLWGSALNAFQQTIPASMTDKIQFVRLHGFHDYQITEAVPARKVGKGTQPATPAASRERITVNIDARDFGNPADQNYDRFKNAIVSVPFFKESLSAEGILLKSVSPPLKDPIEQRDYIQFTLECKFPPAIRNE